MIYLSNKVKKLGLKLNYIIAKSTIIEKTNKIDEIKNSLINEVFKNWNKDKIENNPILLEYRNLHKLTLGDKGEKYTASPEWLINFILDNKRFISISDVVDCYNIISAKYLIAIGSHDLDKIEGQLKIDVTSGKERFVPLGMTDKVSVPKGAYAFSDDKDILCFFEARQCDKTKITPQTKTFITYLQGNAKTTQDYLNKATQELLNLYKKYCQGEFKANTVSNMMMEPGKAEVS